jgi:hypothetical protein
MVQVGQSSLWTPAVKVAGSLSLFMSSSPSFSHSFLGRGYDSVRDLSFSESRSSTIVSSSHLSGVFSSSSISRFVERVEILQLPKSVAHDEQC